MVKHNNVVPNQHFHKKWARRVKTWFDQPAQKKIRRERRKLKAAQVAPRPAAGSLRPLVRCPTQKYNSKLRLGKGFTLEELKDAGIDRNFAQTVGISVDHRRTNKCTESLTLNVNRLKEYKARLVVFPRRANRVKKGDSDKATIAEAQQLQGAIIPAPAKSDAVTFVAITEEMKAARGYGALRLARSDANLVGIRLKKSKEEKKEDKPAAAKAEE
mmetsp:Transcript_31920/g.45955  ORF Transcript_31920/g.45955 Transcript_31920/m.45955 type:complete len:215 (-) Transcript_31920:60-704(-)